MRYHLLATGHIIQMGHFPTNDIIAEMSNPGPVGVDTGFVFKAADSGQSIRVIAHKGEERAHAIARVKARHGNR